MQRVEDRTRSHNLVMEFDGCRRQGTAAETCALAFREAIDRRSVVEVRCSYTEARRFRQQVFRAALRSLMENPPNQSLQTTRFRA